MTALCINANKFEHLINLTRRKLFIDAVKIAKTFANLSSSYLIPLVMGEEKKANVSQKYPIYSKINLRIAENVCIIESNLKNKGNPIKSANSNLLLRENFEGTLGFLNELSIDSIKLAKFLDVITKK